MTGRHVGADEALAIGLADRVLPDDELLAVALEDARAFASGPTTAYAAVKRAVSRGFDRALDEGLTIEAEQFARVFTTTDARIGVKAFLDKERPTFTGS